MFAMQLDFFTKDLSFPFYIQYGEHSTDLYIHTHADFSELVIVLEGSATHIVDGEAYTIEKGDVFVISDNIAHGYQNTKNFKLCNIMFHQEQLFLSDFDIRKSAGFHALFIIEPFLTKEHFFQSRLLLCPNDFDEISNIISNMVNEYNKKTVGWKTMLQSYFMTLIIKLSRTYEHSSRPSSSSDLIYIANAVSYIENNYTEKLTIKELSEISHLSERHFGRIFQASYGITPMNYVLSLRMQKAQSLLTSTSLRITDIALQCGFNDSNYFSRQFMKYYKKTPREYRQ